MAASTKCRFVIIVCFLQFAAILASQELMLKMSGGFRKVVGQCAQELKIGDHIMEDFKNYWQEDYALLNRDFGCMVVCMASKLDLISEDTKLLHHGNAEEFAKSHGADDATAKQLVAIVKDCEAANAQDDHCMRMLEVSKCFRTKIHALKWAPPMELLMEELMAA
uniref:Odorant binding protein PBP1 n=1 Tax=Clostera restitura TaxID=2008422 RepID=A0A346FW85_9NEOP|nr:odorant binding protein PBP1 [Clostera restitura]